MIQREIYVPSLDQEIDVKADDVDQLKDYLQAAEELLAKCPSDDQAGMKKLQAICEAYRAVLREFGLPPEEVKGMLAYDERGKIRQTIGNCVAVFQNDEKLKGMFRFNEFTDKTEVHGAWWLQSSANLSDNSENNIRLYLEAIYGLVHEKNIPRAIDIVAHQRPYHPIKERLEGLQWDGGKYIENLLPRYLGAERSDYTTQATKLTLLGAIERIYHPGTKFEEMLCLVEDRQGGGKSTMVRLLALEDDWFSDDIKDLDDENVYRKLQGHWVIEFSEMLATANAKTVESIKSFLSRQKDTYKVPYEKYPHDFPRQCIFIGTSNNLDFLPSDRTGNRRFIPVKIDSRQAEVHPLEDEAETRAYIDRCWAQAMAIYRSGEYKLKFPEDLQKILSEMQQEFTPEDPKVGIIQEWLNACGHNSVCSRMIYKEALGRDFQEPREWELKEINAIMNKSIEGWKKHPTSDHKVRFSGYGKQRAWDRIVPQKNVPDGFIQVDLEDMVDGLPFE